MSEFKSKVNNIKKRVHRTTLYISTNLREEDKTRFIEFSNSQFKGDYGIALRWLLDLSEGYFVKPNDALQEQINLLAEEVQKLKKEPETKLEEKKPKRRMLDGSYK